MLKYDAFSACILVAANRMTYVLSLILEQLMRIFMVSFFDTSSLFLFTVFGNHNFDLNFPGLICLYHNIQENFQLLQPIVEL
jgi:hypothetical protein